MSARLIGYLANESVESKVTCLEWKQFYPLKLNPTIPNVLVIAGFDPENKLKFFYPNSFVYIVMDSDNDDDDEDETSIPESELTNVSEEVDFDLIKKSKEEDMTIEQSNEFPDFYSLFEEDANDSDSSTSCFDTDSSSESSNSNDSEALKKFEASKQAYRGEVKNIKDCANDSMKMLTSNNKKKSSSTKPSFNSRNKKSHSHRDNLAGHSKSTSANTLASNSKSKESSKSTSDFFDTLDATIDSVARNYGTQLQGKDSVELTPQNKSISLSSPLSITALSSPTSSPLNILATQQSALNKTNSPIIGPISPSINSMNDGTISSPKQRKPSMGSIGSPLKLGHYFLIFFP
jgi:hypothetical protein